MFAARQPFTKTQGVIVRDEGEIIVIWTKKFNHVYVREKNFNRLEHYVYDWIGVVVVNEARQIRVKSGEYKYEAVECVNLLPIENEDPRTSPDEEYNDVKNRRMVCDFQKCEDSENRVTLRWRDRFELVNSSGKGLIQSVKRPDGRPGFIEQAFIPGGDRNQLSKNKICTFDAFVILDFIADKSNPVPWRLHKYYIDGEMDINGFLGRSGCLLRGPGGVPVDKKSAHIPPDTLIPKQNPSGNRSMFAFPTKQQSIASVQKRAEAHEIWGICFAKFDGHYGFYASASLHNGKFSEGALRVPLVTNMEVGSWYRLYFNAKLERLLELHSNTPVNGFFNKVEQCSPPPESEIICRPVLGSHSKLDAMLAMTVRAVVDLNEESISSKHIRSFSDYYCKVLDMVVPVLKERNQISGSFIMDVVLSPEQGFIITEVLDVDEGQSLKTYLSADRFVHPVPPDAENRNDSPVPQVDILSLLPHRLLNVRTAGAKLDSSAPSKSCVRGTENLSLANTMKALSSTSMKQLLVKEGLSSEYSSLLSIVNKEDAPGK